MLSDSIYVKFPEATPQRQKADEWLPGAGRGWGGTANGYGVSSGGDKNVLELDGYTNL